jgi:hypothetical protein
MGYARPRPKRLAEKLLQIRNALGLSQTELWRKLGVEDEIPFKRISKYELDQNGVHMEDIVDDELDLPDKLPGPVNYKGLKPATRSRSKKR